jgi:signal transduction histidine kinase
LKKDTIPDKQKKDFICRAENEVNRVNTIIRQLLDFARQPPNESQSEISVHKAINEVVEICKVQPMMAGIAIDVEDAAADNFVIASSGQLKQVFLNLLINSADAINSADNGPQDGRILVRTINVAAGNSGLTGAGIRIQISDNGPGIETGDLENIFDPFYTSKEPGKGTGLGLSICFTLIENMGGIIRAASDSEGTTLTVILPLSSMSAQIPG